MSAVGSLDRRPPARGDERRTALLGALDELLRDAELEAINVADISRRAGVSRSAFYFYFESKAVAVAALVAEFYDAAFAATRILVGDRGSPRWRIEHTIRELFASLRRHEHLFAAMLEARAASATVRALWDRDRLSFVGPVAAMIAAERAAGRAPEGPDPTTLATVLLECNDRALERRCRGGPPEDVEEHVQALVTLWLRTIFGRVGDADEHPDDEAAASAGTPEEGER